MNNPLDELFSLYCMKQLKMPPDLQELPQYDALVSGLSRKQRAGLIELFDEFTAGFSDVLPPPGELPDFPENRRKNP